MEVNLSNKFGSKIAQFYFEHSTLYSYDTPNISNNDNRPYHGFRWHLDRQVKWAEITVFVWESDSK